MNEPVVNILLRASRPDYLSRCVKSIEQQSYSNVVVHCTIDEDKWRGADTTLYPWQSITRVRRSQFPFCSHPWNLYCNVLKSKVESGWFFFLDDDDQLASPNAIEEALRYIDAPSAGLIFQMIRWGELIPDAQRMQSAIVERKHIGMPCAFLPAGFKNVADFDGEKAADFRFIRSISRTKELKFVEHVLVAVDVKNEGAYHGQRSK